MGGTSQKLRVDPKHTTEFFVAHRTMLEKLLLEGHLPKDLRRALAEDARKHFGYSERTAVTDILRILRRRFGTWVRGGH